MKTKRVLKKNAIKAYKAFNKDLTCQDFQYEVGKEYHHKGKLELCEAGFHACERLPDCFNFYPFSKAETRVAEVLVWGKVAYEDTGDKLCASNIKVVRELAWSEVLPLCNSGHSNSGYGNSGSRNSGDWNSCSRNSGNGNSGHRNSGSWNNGNGNSGDCNSGDCNSGSNNSGNWNAGHWNAGHWNAGHWNSGYLNTSAQKYCFIFNKQVEKSALAKIEFPEFLHFTLTEWIPGSKMSQQEKKQHPEYATTGGYLKKYTYKEAFRKSFEKAKQLPNWPDQLKRLKALPNFDAKIFEEISGISSKDLGISDKELADKTKIVMEVTMADIEKIFGCKIKIVKES